MLIFVIYLSLIIWKQEMVIKSPRVIWILKPNPMNELKNDIMAGTMDNNESFPEI